MRTTLLFLTIGLVAGCTVPTTGYRFDEEEGCWKYRFAFFTTPGVDDATVFAADPRGNCWFFVSWPPFPEGWTVDDRCMGLPGTEDFDITEEEECGE